MWLYYRPLKQHFFSSMFFRCCYYWPFLFAKLLRSLTMNYSSPKSRIIFVSPLLNFCNTDLNYVTTLLQLHPSLNHYFWGVYSQRQIQRNSTSAFSWTWGLLQFSGKMRKFLRSLAEYLVALAFLCCHYIFHLYITCLALSFNTVYLYFHWY